MIPARNPRVLQVESLLFKDYRKILDQYSKMLDYDLAPPQAGGLYGLEFKGKIISLRHLYQLEVAHRIKQIFSDSPGSCLEVRGGAGFSTYAAVKIGVTKDFSVIDLPLVNVLQGYLLLKSDLAEHVTLYGETKENKSDDDPSIQILPDVAIHDFKDSSIDMAINVDSMPEMKESTMRNYLTEVQRVSRKYFLSINQEMRVPNATGFVHGWVHDVMKEYPRFKLSSRSQHWLRKGYVEEIYILEGSN